MDVWLARRSAPQIVCQVCPLFVAREVCNTPVDCLPETSHIAALAVHSICVSVVLTLAAEPFTRLVPSSEVGMRIGTCGTILAIGTIAGVPISEVILDSIGSFNYSLFYAGVSSVLLISEHLK